MERYLETCSESTAHCLDCETELIEDEEGNKELRELQAKGCLTMPMQLKCPKCGMTWSKDNPYIYFSTKKFVRKIRSEKIWWQIKSFFRRSW